MGLWDDRSLCLVPVACSGWCDWYESGAVRWQQRGLAQAHLYLHLYHRSGIALSLLHQFYSCTRLPVLVVSRPVAFIERGSGACRHACILCMLRHDRQPCMQYGAPMQRDCKAFVLHMDCSCAARFSYVCPEAAERMYRLSTRPCL